VQRAGRGTRGWVRVRVSLWVRVRVKVCSA
jgi:hypothetical protein